MTNIIRTEILDTDLFYPILVVGGGGCGLCAALAVRDAGLDVLVLERDRTPLGTTSMSTGLIPAAGTREQLAKGIADSATQYAEDILAKTKNEADPVIVEMLAGTSADTVAWLQDQHGLELALLDDFLYPGHSQMRMYGMPNRSGQELMAGLSAAAETAGVDILTEALVQTLYINSDDTLLGVGVNRPDGSAETIACEAIILACCGFAGDPELVTKYIPEMSQATFHGHPGNKGHAVIWGQAVNAKLADMGAYQGHGGLAYGLGVPILWPLIMQGGFQVNSRGDRFSDETRGYSEQAKEILEQPGSVAWSVYGQSQHELMQKFDDYHEAWSGGGVKTAPSIAALAEIAGLPQENLEKTVADISNCVRNGVPDRFGREFSKGSEISPPFYIAKVTGALFHTQGGLEIDVQGRVLKEDGHPFLNLFAGGGAARGISGGGASGYMAGNGLLTATSLGKVSGRAAAEYVRNRELAST